MYCSLCLIQRVVLLSNLFYFVTETSFDLGEKGKKQCNVGYEEISDTEECKKACNTLQISPSKSFQNGKPCIKGGNSKCKQANTVGPKAFMVCKKIGKLLSLAHLSKHHKKLILLIGN